MRTGKLYGPRVKVKTGALEAWTTGMGISSLGLTNGIRSLPGGRPAMVKGQSNRPSPYRWAPSWWVRPES